MKHIRLQTTTLLFMLCAIVALAQQPQPTAAVPKLVRFSGSFRPASGTPAQTMESVTLSVYRDQTGGDALWHEIQNVVVDADGHYSVLMGATQNEGCRSICSPPENRAGWACSSTGLAKRSSLACCW